MLLGIVRLLQIIGARRVVLEFEVVSCQFVRSPSVFWLIFSFCGNSIIEQVESTFQQKIIAMVGFVRVVGLRVGDG
jgi:hypothetical protein